MFPFNLVSEDWVHGTRGFRDYPTVLSHIVISEKIFLGPWPLECLLVVAKREAANERTQSWIRYTSSRKQDNASIVDLDVAIAMGSRDGVEPTRDKSKVVEACDFVHELVGQGFKASHVIMF